MTLTHSAPLILHKGHVVQLEQPENRKYTLPKKTNIARENRPSQKESSLQKEKIRGYVKLRGVYSVATEVCWSEKCLLKEDVEELNKRESFEAVVEIFVAFQ